MIKMNKNRTKQGNLLAKHILDQALCPGWSRASPDSKERKRYDKMIENIESKGTAGNVCFARHHLHDQFYKGGDRNAQVDWEKVEVGQHGSLSNAFRSRQDIANLYPERQAPLVKASQRAAAKVMLQKVTQKARK